jgi:hypothetical protein
MHHRLPSIETGCHILRERRHNSELYTEDLLFLADSMLLLSLFCVNVCWPLQISLSLSFSMARTQKYKPISNYVMTMSVFAMSSVYSQITGKEEKKTRSKALLFSIMAQQSICPSLKE